MSRERLKSFCSKVLLFGEYSVIQNSMALAIPFHLFEGKLAFPKDKMKGGHPPGGVDQELVEFARYLKTLPYSFDLSSFEFDLGQGLFFESSIPEGFGVGSSGALCAAIFHRYALGEFTTWPIPEEQSFIRQLKEIFAAMESHFHGESSGLDPLISYCNRPVLISQGGIEMVEVPKMPSNGQAMFLVNTNRPRKTGPLVSLFLEKCKDPQFQASCEEELLKITDNCISSFLSGDFPGLFENFAELSSFQLDHFGPMIPPHFHAWWKQGLQTKDYLLKLCGAGGGGFLLGLTKDFEVAKQALKDFQLRRL